MNFQYPQNNPQQPMYGSPAAYGQPVQPPQLQGLNSYGVFSGNQWPTQPQGFRPPGQGNFPVSGPPQPWTPTTMSPWGMAQQRGQSVVLQNTSMSVQRQQVASSPSRASWSSNIPPYRSSSPGYSFSTPRTKEHQSSRDERRTSDGSPRYSNSSRYDYADSQGSRRRRERSPDRDDHFSRKKFQRDRLPGDSTPEQGFVIDREPTRNSRSEREERSYVRRKRHSNSRERSSRRRSKSLERKLKSPTRKRSITPDRQKQSNADHQRRHSPSNASSKSYSQSGDAARQQRDRMKSPQDLFTERIQSVGNMSPVSTLQRNFQHPSLFPVNESAVHIQAPSNECSFGNRIPGLEIPFMMTPPQQDQPVWLDEQPISQPKPEPPLWMEEAVKQNTLVMGNVLEQDFTPAFDNNCSTGQKRKRQRSRFKKNVSLNRSPELIVVQPSQQFPTDHVPVQQNLPLQRYLPQVPEPVGRRNTPTHNFGKRQTEFIKNIPNMQKFKQGKKRKKWGFQGNNNMQKRRTSEIGVQHNVITIKAARTVSTHCAITQNGKAFLYFSAKKWPNKQPVSERSKIASVFQQCVLPPLPLAWLSGKKLTGVGFATSSLSESAENIDSKELESEIDLPSVMSALGKSDPPITSPSVLSSSDVDTKVIKPPIILNLVNKPVQRTSALSIPNSKSNGDQVNATPNDEHGLPSGWLSSEKFSEICSNWSSKKRDSENLSGLGEYKTNDNCNERALEVTPTTETESVDDKPSELLPESNSSKPCEEQKNSGDMNDEIVLNEKESLPVTKLIPPPPAWELRPVTIVKDTQKLSVDKVTDQTEPLAIQSKPKSVKQKTHENIAATKTALPKSVNIKISQGVEKTEVGKTVTLKGKLGTESHVAEKNNVVVAKKQEVNLKKTVIGKGNLKTGSIKTAPTKQESNAANLKTNESAEETVKKIIEEKSTFTSKNVSPSQKSSEMQNKLGNEPRPSTKVTASPQKQLLKKSSPVVSSNSVVDKKIISKVSTTKGKNLLEGKMKGLSQQELTSFESKDKLQLVDENIGIAKTQMSRMKKVQTPLSSKLVLVKRTLAVKKPNDKMLLTETLTTMSPKESRETKYVVSREIKVVVSASDRLKADEVLLKSSGDKLGGKEHNTKKKIKETPPHLQKSIFPIQQVSSPKSTQQAKNPLVKTSAVATKVKSTEGMEWIAWETENSTAEGTFANKLNSVKEVMEVRTDASKKSQVKKKPIKKMKTGSATKVESSKRCSTVASETGNFATEKIEEIKPLSESTTKPVSAESATNKQTTGGKSKSLFIVKDLEQLTQVKKQVTMKAKTGSTAKTNVCKESAAVDKETDSSENEKPAAGKADNVKVISGDSEQCIILPTVAPQVEEQTTKKMKAESVMVVESSEGSKVIALETKIFATENADDKLKSPEENSCLSGGNIEENKPLSESTTKPVSAENSTNKQTTEGKSKSLFIVKDLEQLTPQVKKQVTKKAKTGSTAKTNVCKESAAVAKETDSSENEKTAAGKADNVKVISGDSEQCITLSTVALQVEEQTTKKMKAESVMVVESSEGSKVIELETKSFTTENADDKFKSHEQNSCLSSGNIEENKPLSESTTKPVSAESSINKQTTEGKSKSLVIVKDLEQLTPQVKKQVTKKAKKGSTAKTNVCKESVAAAKETDSSENEKTAAGKADNVKVISGDSEQCITLPTLAPQVEEQTTKKMKAESVMVVETFEGSKVIVLETETSATEIAGDKLKSSEECSCLSGTNIDVSDLNLSLPKSAEDTETILKTVGSIDNKLSNDNSFCDVQKSDKNLDIAQQVKEMPIEKSGLTEGNTISDDESTSVSILKTLEEVKTLDKVCSATGVAVENVLDRIFCEETKELNSSESEPPQSVSLFTKPLQNTDELYLQDRLCDEILAIIKTQIDSNETLQLEASSSQNIGVVGDNRILKENLLVKIASEVTPSIESCSKENLCETKETGLSDNKCETKKTGLSNNKCETKETGLSDNKCETKETGLSDNKLGEVMMLSSFEKSKNTVDWKEPQVASSGFQDSFINEVTEILPLLDSSLGVDSTLSDSEMKLPTDISVAVARKHKREKEHETAVTSSKNQRKILQKPCPASHKKRQIDPKEILQLEASSCKKIGVVGDDRILKENLLAKIVSEVTPSVESSSKENLYETKEIGLSDDKLGEETLQNEVFTLSSFEKSKNTVDWKKPQVATPGFQDAFIREVTEVLPLLNSCSGPDSTIRKTEIKLPTNISVAVAGKRKREKEDETAVKSSKNQGQILQKPCPASRKKAQGISYEKLPEVETNRQKPKYVKPCPASRKPYAATGKPCPARHKPFPKPCPASCKPQLAMCKPCPASRKPHLALPKPCPASCKPKKEMSVFQQDNSEKKQDSLSTLDVDANSSTSPHNSFEFSELETKVARQSASPLVVTQAEDSFGCENSPSSSSSIVADSPQTRSRTKPLRKTKKK